MESNDDNLSDKNLLKSLVVRLARPEEMELWRQKVGDLHYLGCPRFVGEQIYYIAETKNKNWVALLAWTSAALKLSDRDQWIGWDNLAKRTRLNLIANNSRFLVLKSVPNLASRVLALNLKRLSADWSQEYGHSILLCETFVDIKRFKGSCYLASGWTSIGETKGFTRTSTGYKKNFQKKAVFIKELENGARNILSMPFYPQTDDPNKEVFMIDTNCLPIAGTGGLIEVIKSIKDTRKRRGKRHSLTTVVSASICALLSGAKTFEAIYDWIESLTSAEYQRFQPWKIDSLPSISTIRRVLISIDAQRFDEEINKWLRSRLGTAGEYIAVDGKTLRGSRDGEKNGIHLISAILQEEKIVIAQRSVGEKTNEIPEMINLLQPLDLNGSVITADAMHTQSKTAEFIVKEKGADFIFTVKGNQPKLEDQMKSLNYEAFSP